MAPCPTPIDPLPASALCCSTSTASSSSPRSRSPGAAQALAALAERRIPYRIVTNTSLVSRATLSRWSARLGAPIPADRFQSALSVSAAYTARRFPGQPLYVLTSDDARSEFAGQHLMTDEEAGKRDAHAAAVVVGDSPEAATWDNLNRAFRLIRNGAELIGMHMNRWWLTPDGPTIDSGAYRRRAGVREWRQGDDRRQAGSASSSPRLPPSSRPRSARAADRASAADDIAMVGDDLDTDVRAAQRAGLRGAFVLTGKHTRADVAERARANRPAPDLVADSLAGVVAALD